MKKKSSFELLSKHMVRKIIWDKERDRTDRNPTRRKSIPFVIQALKEVGKPMRIPQIMEVIEAPTKAAAAKNAVWRDVALYVKEFGDEAEIVRVSEGLYALREWGL